MLTQVENYPITDTVNIDEYSHLDFLSSDAKKRKIERESIWKKRFFEADGIAKKQTITEEDINALLSTYPNSTTR